MKNLILVFLLALTVPAFAQSGSLKSVTNGSALDTVVNTATKSQFIQIAGSQAFVSVITTVTEISGTTGGTVKLYGSIDGVDYALIDANTFIPADQTAAQSFAWSVTPSKYAFYKVTYVGTGTMSAKIATKALWRK